MPWLRAVISDVSAVTRRCLPLPVYTGLPAIVTITERIAEPPRMLTEAVTLLRTQLEGLTIRISGPETTREWKRAVARLPHESTAVALTAKRPARPVVTTSDGLLGSFANVPLSVAVTL